MRRAARIDSTQKEIVKTLRSIGATVLHTHTLKNCFDILVGWKGQNFAFEIKSDAKQKLTSGEEDFQTTWRGHVAVITSATEALEIIGAVKSGKSWKENHSR